MATNELAQNLVKTLQDVFGRTPGVRPSHAHGVFLRGTFVPTDSAKRLSTAPHFNRPTTDVVARLSLFTGFPNLASTDPQATPHGFAVRFVLDAGEGLLGTDIVSQSSTLFPGSTGEEILAFFEALRDGVVDDYAKSHPAAAAFMKEKRQVPCHFGTQSFYSINAFRLVDAYGKAVSVRYRWVPLAGRRYLTQAELDAKASGFLFDELPGVLEEGPIVFKLVVQVAEQGDVVDDCTQIWPEERKLTELGTLKLEKIAEPAELPSGEKLIVFSPIPGVQGVEASDDPILAARSAVYRRSGKERRDAEL